MQASDPTGHSRPAGDRTLGTMLVLALLAASCAHAQEGQDRQMQAGTSPAAAAAVKRILDTSALPDLLAGDKWQAIGEGFERDGKDFACDNAASQDASRGLSQLVVLDQDQPMRLLASAASKAQDVGGDVDSGYCLQLLVTYQDGTSDRRNAWFAIGSHNWQVKTIDFMPPKAVKQAEYRLVFKGHSGKAWFGQASLRQVKLGAGQYMFDGLAISSGVSHQGLNIRDVAAGSDFVAADDGQALGVKVDCKTTAGDGVTFFDVTIEDTTGRDRAVTLIYSQPVAPRDLHWLDGPRSQEPVAAGGQYWHVNSFHAGSNGLLSYYPFAAVSAGKQGKALGIDLAVPAFFRAGYSAGAGELYLAYDIGLAPEKPKATVRFCRFDFDGRWGFRAALARYYELFPESFRNRTPEQGLWMPFAAISQVKGWQDFGFKFKEGNNEVRWDDQHGITTFHYSEPLTWWMKMPPEMPRTYEAALALAKKLAAEGDANARSWVTSAIYDQDGRPAARLRKTPWCDGAVWSINSMPNVPGDINDFQQSWSPGIKRRLYGALSRGRLDGEYIDSIEGWECEELNFRREHFAAARTPLCFAPDSHKPAIFKGLIVFEYVRAIADDMHADGKLMMANGTPGRLCWLAGLLDVMGTETNWNRSGRWRPMSDRDLLFRRSMAATRPYCFLMNTDFEQLGYEKTEKYMKRALAYGMMPGFFSPVASGSSHYFKQPELYERDRPLFKKYVPLCKLVAEALWQPVTLATSSDEKVYVERFGRRYLTVFNDSDKRRTATITLEGLEAREAAELLRAQPVAVKDGRFEISLDGEDVAVIDLAPTPTTTAPAATTSGPADEASR